MDRWGYSLGAMPKKNNPQFKFNLLGAFEVWRGSKRLPEIALGQRKTRTLLKLLLSPRGRIWSQSQLLEHLYPNSDPDKVLKNLLGRISELRKALEPDLKKGTDSAFVVRSGQGNYTFSDRAPCWVDTEAFLGEVETAGTFEKSGHWLRAIKHYKQAADLYRDDFLVEDTHEGWVQSFGRRLHESLLGALLQMAECHARLEDHQAAIALAQRVVDQDSVNEGAYRQLMRYHYHVGQRRQIRTCYHACVQALREELKAKPAEETRALYAQLNQGQSPVRQRSIPSTLPRMDTKFIGRQKEMEQLEPLLENPEVRLLTLVGPGGVGKTRLAIQAAANVQQEFSQGVYFVELEGMKDPAGLVLRLAGSLGFHFVESKDPQTQLFDFLREKRMLLVLDGFEHLLEATDVLVALLDHAPQVKLLITSRQQLKRQLEWTFPVAGLGYPPVDQTSAAVRNYPAMQLFQQRALQLKADFVTDKHEHQAIVRICRCLHGNPLGVELAVAWVQVLSCREIADGIEASLDFLKSPTTADKEVPRTSLRAVFEHSWGLLTEAEAEAFGALCVFQGGFRREAAQAVARIQVSMLLSLLSKSFISRAQSGSFTVHTLLRQFGLEKLSAQPRQEALMRTQHARYFLDWLGQQQAPLIGPQAQATLSHIEVDLDNVRAAWQWAAHHKAWPLLEAATNPFARFFHKRAFLKEGQVAFARVVRALNEKKRFKQAEKRLLAIALTRQGGFEAFLGNLAYAEEIIRQGLVRARQAGCWEEEGQALFQLGNVLRELGRLEQSRQCYEQSLDIFRGFKPPHQAVPDVLHGLGGLMQVTGNFAAAQKYLGQSLQLYETLQYSEGIAESMGNLSIIACALGDYKKGEALCREGIELHKRQGRNDFLVNPLSTLGGILFVQGRYEDAITHYKEALALSRETGSRSYTGQVLDNLGEAALTLGDVKQAEAYLQESLQIHEE